MDPLDSKKPGVPLEAPPYSPITPAPPSASQADAFVPSSPLAGLSLRHPKENEPTAEPPAAASPPYFPSSPPVVMPPASPAKPGKLASHSTPRGGKTSHPALPHTPQQPGAPTWAGSLDKLPMSAHQDPLAKWGIAAPPGYLPLRDPTTGTDKLYNSFYRVVDLGTSRTHLYRDEGDISTQATPTANPKSTGTGKDGKKPTGGNTFPSPLSKSTSDGTDDKKTKSGHTFSSPLSASTGQLAGHEVTTADIEVVQQTEATADILPRGRGESPAEQVDKPVATTEQVAQTVEAAKPKIPFKPLVKAEQRKTRSMSGKKPK